MPALTAIAASTALKLCRSMAAAFAGAANRIRNRRAAGRLSGLDDRMLADIGLTRSDLRDAYSEPLWQDPTDVLARRVAERRESRRPFGLTPPPSCAGLPEGWSRPPVDRPARHLM